MILANETGVEVFYWISCDGGSVDCGNISVDGIADLPYYDNQTNVAVSFLPADGTNNFSTTWDTTQSGQQTEMTLVAE
jgi:hypothetical protein